MTVKEFIDGYNKTTTNLKDRYIKEKLTVNNYVNFRDKCNLAEKTIKTTCFEYDKEGNTTGNIKINSISRYLIFTMSVIDLYTNLDVDFDNIFNEYDILKESGFLDILIGCENQLIPISEYMELQAILNMVLDDLLQNNLSTQAFIKTQVERFGTMSGIILSPFVDKLADNINNIDENTIEKIGNKLENVLGLLSK